MNIRVTLVPAFAALAAAHIAAAQPAQQGAVPLTLEDAISRGIESSHRIAEAAARSRAAEAAVRARRAAGLPVLAIMGGYQRTNHVEQFGVLLPDNQLRVIYPDVPDNYRARLDVQWPLYTGGRVASAERAARAEAGAAASDIDALRNDLRLEITRAYWTLVTARESVVVLEQALERMQAHLADVKNRLDAGLVPPSDVLSVQAQASRQQMLNIQARSARDVAEADLARLVGLPMGTAITTTTALSPPPEAGSMVRELAETARGRRQDRAALAQRADAARERTRAAAAGLKPSVALGGGFDYARPNPRIFPREASWRESWDAGVNVSWPLFDGGRTRAETTEAAEVVRSFDARLAEFDEVLTVELRQRLSELESTLAVLTAADDAIRAAAEARRVVGERFAAGVATSTEVLDAQVALLQAELDRTQAIAAARMAETRLQRSVGL
jgi:outer membrane protein TolC